MPHEKSRLPAKSVLLKEKGLDGCKRKLKVGQKQKWSIEKIAPFCFI
jgi:hypothetical protein